MFVAYLIYYPQVCSLGTLITHTTYSPYSSVGCASSLAGAAAARPVLQRTESSNWSPHRTAAAARSSIVAGTANGGAAPCPRVGHDRASARNLRAAMVR